MDAFGVDRPDLVSKDLAGAVRMTTKAGKTVTLKAKEAPVKAIIRGEDLVHAAPKPRGRHAKISRGQKAAAGAKRVGGYLLREAGYRPDYATMAFLNVPKLMGKMG